jgi:hypothetical protein
MVIVGTTRTRIQFDEPLDEAGLLAAKAGQTRFLVVPERRYFMIDGHGAPGSPSFEAAFGALFPVAYTVHFTLKRRGVAMPVGAIEGLYWFGDREGPVSPNDFSQHDAADWNWRLLLPVPEAATADELAGAVADVARKKSPPALGLLRVQSWREGPSVQTLHVGSYTSEPTTIAALHDSLSAVGLRPRGCHHEIYISDPKRTPAARLKTIIRQPVEFGPGIR